MLAKWKAFQSVLLAKGIKPGVAVIFARLLDHYNLETGLCYPSVLTLATALGISTRQVRSCLRVLEKAGYIRTLIGMGPNGSNLYEIPLLTGSIASPRAEVLRRKGRMNTSAKTRKNSEEKQAPGKIEPFGRRGSSPSPQEAKAKKESNIEKAFAEALGGGEAGWEALMDMPLCVLNEAKHRHSVDGVPCLVAVREALTKLGEQDNS